MSSAEERVQDALRLWSLGRREGAFLLAIVAVIVRAKQVYPSATSDGDAFQKLIADRFQPRLSVEFRGEQWPIERVFYKWFRCEIVHQGNLPVDVRFMDDAAEDELTVRAGGRPEFVLLVSPGWFHQLVEWARS